MSTGDIGGLYNANRRTIHYWIKKHKIKARSISEAVALKPPPILWGKDNPAFGKCGPLDKSWKGGLIPERYAFYSSAEWSELIKIVWKLYNNECDRCKENDNKSKGMHIHHIVPFEVKELRAVIENLVLLCRKCHEFVHSKKNINKEYILDYGQFKQLHG